MLREPSSDSTPVPPGILAWGALRGASAGLRIHSTRATAMSRPGIAETKNAERQPNASARWVEAMGPMPPPIRAAPRFSMMPMFSPRRCSEDSSEITDWPMGVSGPSATPRTQRAASSMAKPAARPDSAENSENSTSMTTRIGLRRPVPSASEASRNPEPAMVTDRPEASSPSWVLFRWNSGTM